MMQNSGTRNRRRLEMIAISREKEKG